MIDPCKNHIKVNDYEIFSTNDSELNMSNDYEKSDKLLNSILEKIETKSSPNETKKKLAFSKHNKWTKEEDEKLLYLINLYGKDNWNFLSKQMGSRNARQCKERFQYYLDPDIKSDQWTPEEDQLILLKRQELGPKWTIIKKFFNNRTDAMIKTRYNALIRAKRIREKKMLINSKISESKKAKMKFKVAKIILPIGFHKTENDDDSYYSSFFTSEEDNGDDFIFTNNNIQFGNEDDIIFY